MTALHETFDTISLDDLRRRTSIKWRTAPADTLPSFVAEMDFPAAEAIQRRLREAIDRSDFGYTPYDPRQQLGDALASYAADTWGWSVDPAGIVVIADVMRGIELCIDVFTEPGAQVVVNTPIYPPFLHAVHDSGRTLVESPLAWVDGRPRLDLDDLEARFAAGAQVYLLCHPHNPTGVVASVDELRRIAALAKAHDVLVVSDEVHAPLTYPGTEFTPLLKLPEAADVAVALTSASKAWNIPGLKTAALVTADTARHQLLYDLPVRTRMGASILGIHANVAAWSEGRQWLADVVGYLDGTRTLLAELLADELPQVGYAVPDATYLAWLDLRSSGLENPTDTVLERGRLALSDGATFGDPGKGWARLNFATSRALVTEQVRRLASALR